MEPPIDAPIVVTNERLVLRKGGLEHSLPWGEIRGYATVAWRTYSVLLVAHGEGSSPKRNLASAHFDPEAPATRDLLRAIESNAPGKNVGHFERNNGGYAALGISFAPVYLLMFGTIAVVFLVFVAVVILTARRR